MIKKKVIFETIENLCLTSKYDNSYHKEEEDWFPNLCNVIKAGFISLSQRFNPFPI